jgi:hypothetical protein
LGEDCQAKAVRQTSQKVFMLKWAVILFNLVSDYITKKLDIRGNLSTNMVQNNAYADDVDIISRNLKATEEALEELGNTAQAIGSIINQEKTKYI